MDARAFERLVREHQQMVYCVALSYCKDAAAAEDVAQEAFLKAYRNFDGVRRPEKVKTWLYSIARFTAIDWVRRRSHEQPAPLPDRAAPPPGGDDRASRVMDLLRGLPESYREIVVLRYVEGLSYVQIARALGSTTSAVGEKLSRIRDILREKLRTEVPS